MASKKETSWKRHIPNALTTTRLLLLVPFVFLFVNGEYLFATFAYLVALATDIDGLVARKLHATSYFGSIFDPFVDGTFMICGFALLIGAARIEIIPVVAYVSAVVFKLVYQLSHLAKHRAVKTTYTSKALGFVGYSVVLAATFGVPLIFTSILLWIGAAGHIILGIAWLIHFGETKVS